MGYFTRVIFEFESYRYGVSKNVCSIKEQLKRNVFFSQDKMWCSLFTGRCIERNTMFYTVWDSMSCKCNFVLVERFRFSFEIFFFESPWTRKCDFLTSWRLVGTELSSVSDLLEHAMFDESRIPVWMSLLLSLKDVS